MERLREFFAKHGVNVGTSGLVVVISANAVQAAPVGLAVAISTAAFASVSAASGTALTILKVMTATKLKLGVVGAVIVAGILIGFLLQREGNDSSGRNNLTKSATPEGAAEVVNQSSRRTTITGFAKREWESAPVTTPEETVARRLAQYGRSRRDLAHALALRHGVEVPDDVKRFFDAVEAGKLRRVSP